MIENCVIVGGGVAGLSAANHLADAGMTPLLVDAGRYPSHRICGEFFSYECLPILNRWGVTMTGHVTHCRLFSGSKKTELHFPKPSASCSRFTFDEMLLNRAKKNGARVLTEVKVISLQPPKHPSEPYGLVLSDGQCIRAQQLMIGTGRIPKMHPSASALAPAYIGFKAHFEGLPIDNCVEMHTFNKGYLGIAPIDSKTTNIACLVKKERVPNWDPNRPNLSIEGILNEENPLSSVKDRLTKAKMIFPSWLSSQVPEFGIRDNPLWERAFFIGDAAGSIPPISGEGLAIAVTSGSMAAEYLLERDAKEFKADWLKRYKRRFFWAQQLHKLMAAPRLGPIAIDLCNLFPSLLTTAWHLTRDHDRD